MIEKDSRSIKWEKRKVVVISDKERPAKENLLRKLSFVYVQATHSLLGTVNMLPCK